MNEPGTGLPTFAHRYEALELLGQGGMATVWRVRDAATSAVVALKVVRADTGAKTALQLQQEFRLAARLRHPNCCAVYDFGVLGPDDPQPGSPYLTMELVDGQDLCARGARTVPEVREIMAQLALALGYVHQQGLVHRDLKGGNVRVRPDGVVKLMDFGLMDFAGHGGAAAGGTVGAIAPEVLRGDPVDGRSDLYALGCLAYELLTGRPPFEGATAAAILTGHLAGRVVPPRELVPDVPEDLDRLVTRLLAKNPADRPRAAADVLGALGRDRDLGGGALLLAPPLVGRDPQVARLEALVAGLVAGERGRLVLIHGEPGLGKSRLVHELRCRAQLAGVAVGVGRALERRAIPYAPLIGALRELWPELRERCAGDLARHGPVLATVAPDLLPGPRAAPLDTPEKDRVRLAAAIGGLLTAFAATRPTVLCVEDWHWVDPPTVGLIAHLRMLAAEVPLAVVLTSRRAETDLATWAGELEALALAELDEAGIGELVGAMLVGDAVPAGLPAAIHRRSGGNPFLAKHALELLAATGRLQRGRNGWRYEPEAEGEGEAGPVEGLDLVRSRLATLPETALTVARIGAALGTTFTAEMLHEVAAFEADELVAAIADLRALGVLTREADDLRFGHDRYRELLYDDMPFDERILIHQLVLDALERRLGGADPASAPLELVTALAEHAMAAGAGSAVARYALPAGERHLALYAKETAARMLEAGLAALPQGEQDERRRAYLLALGDQRRADGRHQAATTFYERADALAGLGPLPPRFFGSWAKSLQAADDYVASLPLAERAVHQAELAGDRVELARAHLTIARIHLFTADDAAAIAAASQALAATEGVAGADVFRADARVFLGFLRAQRDIAQVEGHLAEMREAIADLAAIGDLRGLADSLNKLGTLLIDLERPREAIAVYERGYEVACQGGGLDDTEFALLNMAQAALDLGRPALAVQHVRAARAFQAERRTPYQLGLGLVLEGEATSQLGHLGEGMALVREGMARFRQIGNRYAEQAMAAYELPALWRAGADEEATAAFHRWVAVSEGVASPGILLWQAILASARGDLAAARDAAVRSEALAAERGQDVSRARAMGVLARVALAEGRAADARAMADLATDLAELRGARLVLAAAQGTGGWCALAEGRPAWPYFEQMAAEAEAAGARLYLAQARYGLASAQEGPAAEAQAEDARRILEVAAQSLPELDRASFLARPEIARVVSGERARR